MALGYVFALLAARSLGASEYGAFVLGFSIVNLAVSIALLGLNRGLVRFIAIFRTTKDRARELGVFWLAFGIVAFSSCLAALSVLLLIGHFSDLLSVPPELSQQILGFACWIPILALVYLLAAVTEAIKQIQYRVIVVDIGWPVLRVLLTAGAILAGWQLAGVVWVNVLATGIVVLLIGVSVYRIFLRNGVAGRVIFSPRELLAFSVPVMLFNVVNLTQNQLEIYFLTAFESTKSAGIFNVAARTAIISVAFLEGLGLIFSPLIADLTKRKQLGELKVLFSAITRWSFALGLLVFCLTLLLGQPLLRLFGESFAVAFGALIVLSLAQFLNAATGPVGVLITMSGHSKWNLLNSLLTLVLNFFLNLLLIPLLGILGAAIGGGLAITAVNLLRVAEVYAFTKFHAYNRQFLKPLLAAALATLVAYLAVAALEGRADLVIIVVGALVFGSIYASCIYLWGLSEIDLLILRTARQSALGSLTRNS